MDFSLQYFGISLRELVYEDIQNFFLEVQNESETIEFKSGQGDFDASLTKNIIRTVSALLNSSGGILIWGAPVEKENICHGDLTPLSIIKEKDWLINRITREISYMPIGVNVAILTKDDRCIYIFEIQESKSKPHQYNGNYYIRLDGQSRPAPHYLVDAMFNRVSFAELNSKAEFDLIEENDKYILKINLIVANHSRFIISKKTNCTIICNMGKFDNSRNNTTIGGHNDTLPFGIKWYIKESLTLTKFEKDQILKIEIITFSENSHAQISTYSIKIDEMYNTVQATAISENIPILELK